MDRERQKLEWEMKERQAEEQRIRDEEMMRRHQEELSMRMHHQEDEMRRRQDNNVFMQVIRNFSIFSKYVLNITNRCECENFKKKINNCS